MQCQQIIELLEMHSPPACALEWDNVGLLAGRREKQVHKLLIALDATEDVIGQAVKEGADMLLTHHPLLFSPIKAVTVDDLAGRKLLQLIQKDISYYAMHTSFDVRGMAELSEQKLGLLNTQVLEAAGVREDGTQEGIGRVGTLPKAMTLRKLAEYVKQQFGLEYVRICGKEDTWIERAAVCGGSGKSVVYPAIQSGAEVLISGDLSHHTVLDARDQGLCTIDAGHYGTEKMFVPYIRQYLQRKCTDVIVTEAVEQDPFSVI